MIWPNNVGTIMPLRSGVAQFKKKIILCRLLFTLHEWQQLVAIEIPVN